MKANKLINFRQVSILLTSKPENIRSTYDRQKYKEAVNELKGLVKTWHDKWQGKFNH